MIRLLGLTTRRVAVRTPVTALYSTGKPIDPKHIFTDPQTNRIRDPPNYFQKGRGRGTEDAPLPADMHYGMGAQEAVSEAIGASIRQQRARKRRGILLALVVAVFGTVFGYSIGYRVFYKHSESFLPLWPAKRSRPLSEKDAANLRVAEVKRMAEFRVFERLSMHKMIKEQFGVPLHTQDGKKPETNVFVLWCEDQDPCITGLLFRPSGSHAPDHGHTWHDFLGLVQWRVTHRPVSIRNAAERVLNFIGLGTSDLFQMVDPSKVYGDFKYEFPLPKRNDNDHAMHICFLGEMPLGPDSLVVYRGKYHVGVRLDQVDLFRREDGKLIRYVLYKNS
ncbi:AGL215Wp [Eremothecium gossypii ATCC 10895]|uniref:Altered inheritance of mitochondria protein 39, mitochondrial n=1 Tax=Eremothecium gossypii (strain ATCC 10895 / CBS 109.51 / FGSC 9923 / NRRL Y-1056) TaxID=284811 RepID=AIM39_EREGS|nr:AGL215Wp [Eremothecium gossypii ATCC 10895]Q751C1.1 RecName: Full=Altered inheritance of mitochondria protein 39, mitochondrial; Flags: Precursor [Eremothecium gossypii ATCC 10895]AAS54276.1 AGL215Wp [Eremothecium gossypii ATCC 10895]AEY98602.1 FAGL215Wp [Eremothecium gossypii FDAG1]